MARCLPVAMSHAPGRSGIPDSGHCSKAATNASWASSSATPTSRTMRVRPAISLADSILQTASMARCVSVAVTATDHNINEVGVQWEGRGFGLWGFGLWAFGLGPWAFGLWPWALELRASNYMGQRSLRKPSTKFKDQRPKQGKKPIRL